MTPRAETAFGIDLSGYATGRSACAAATRISAEIEVTILSGCAFSKRYPGGSSLPPILRSEVDLVGKMLHIGPVAVDIPIDLQGLGGPAEISFVWELTRRPVDRALGALAPLADRIGAPTARFRNIVDAGGFGSSLGSRLFETYPAGSLKRLGLKRSDIITAPGSMLNEDETDAAICALTALPEWRLEGQPLADSLARQFEENGMAAGRQLPLGYVLLKANPAKRVHVSKQDVSIWRGGTLQ